MFIANISISNNLYIVRILFLFFAFFLGRRCNDKNRFSCTLLYYKGVGILLKNEKF